MAQNKTRATGASVQAFVAGIEDEARRRDTKVLIDLMRRATGEKPKMWGSSIIGFGSRHYRYETGREGDTPVIGFSPRKVALVIYGAIGFAGADNLLGRLGKHSTGKGCLYIKRMADIDGAVLGHLMAGAAQAKRDRERS